MKSLRIVFLKYYFLMVFFGSVGGTLLIMQLVWCIWFHCFVSTQVYMTAVTNPAGMGTHAASMI